MPALRIFMPANSRSFGATSGKIWSWECTSVTTTIVFPKAPVEARAAPDKFIDFSGDFDAAEARSHDDEAEVPAAALWIQRGLGLFHLTHDVLAKINRIAHDFERERVLDHSGIIPKLLSAPQATTTWS